MNHKDLQCPECAEIMELHFSGRFRYKNGDRRPFYRCVKHLEGCPGSHGAHPDGSPLGFPARVAVKKLRHALHQALYDKYPYSKRKHHQKAALWLQGNGFPEHVGEMNEEQCKTALMVLEK